MIIWILAVLVLGLSATIAYFQGAIRASIATIGIFLGALLAGPLGSLIEPVLKLGGIKNPFIRTMIGPAIVFVIILVIFKIVAHKVHSKIEYTYTYKKSHGEQLRWNRLNSRVGLCNGLLNGTLYLLVLLVPIYAFGYLTTQVASETGDSGTAKIVTTARKHLETSKMDGVVAGFDPYKPEMYDAFDVIGVLKHNPLAINRLWRYPGILSLAERPELQDLANDVEFNNKWQGGATIGELLEQPKVKAISSNPELVEQIRTTLLPDIKDMRQFIETGKSGKYDNEKILGRWEMDVAETFNAEKRRRVNISSVELKQIRARLMQFSGASLIATTDSKVYFKRGDRAMADNQPRLIAEGSWAKAGTGYTVSLEGKSAEATVDDGKLLVPRDGLIFVFEKEI